jgi:hypothetical protein
MNRLTAIIPSFANWESSDGSSDPRSPDALQNQSALAIEQVFSPLQMK